MIPSRSNSTSSAPSKRKRSNKSLFPTFFGNLEWIVAIIVLGAIGYALIEGWTVMDGLYMTIITLSTVGYGETNDLTTVGRVFTAILIFMSIVGMTCWTAQITTNFVSGELSGSSSKRRTKKVIDSLNEHAIVFGSGTMATTIIDRLEKSDCACVVVDNKQEEMSEIQDRYPQALTLVCDPKSELSLSDANVFSAKYVIAALEDDFDNLLIAMSVKEFDPDKIVICRSNDPRVASRMMKIGVESVVCPFQLSGDHVADIITGKKEIENCLNFGNGAIL